MNLYTMMAARAAAGRPVRVGLIGAGKFGSMILSQAQHIEACTSSASPISTWPRPAPRWRASAGRKSATPPRRSGDAVKTGRTCVLDNAAALADCPEIECIVEATGHPIAGVRHALAAIERRQARRHGQRRGRRDVRPADRRPRQGQGRGLQHGLRRPAGHHLRAGRLGARLRLRADLGRQGHELRAALPLFDARHGVGLLRLDARKKWPRATSTRRCTTRSPTAPRRPSRWRRWPTAPDWTARTTAWPSRPPACTIWPRCSARPPTAAGCRAAAWSTSPPARSPTAARSSTTSASASSSPSRRRTNTPRPASSSTAC